ncbi:ABC transporter ATP-binding protein [Candidatus Palauibacter sp.]|uniref:ABC transporter ATP-binding protein n=1 Tax=Candidatus Palauibacter sp. TaxID=3101350 RepID=UPI003CC5972C
MSDSGRRISLFALKRLAPRLRAHRPALVGAGICLLFSTAIGLVFPLVVRYLMDAAFGDGDAALLGAIALGLLGLFALQGLFNFGETYWLGATGERVVTQLRDELFSKLVGLSPGFHAGRASGELTSRLASDCSTLQQIMGHQIAELVRQILFLVGALVLLTFLHWQLMLTTLAVAPIVVLAGFALGRLLRRRSTEVQDRLAEAHAVADEAFGQIEIVQSFVRERWERARYRAGIDAALEAALSRAIVRAVLFGVLTVVAFGGIVIVLWQGGRLVLADQITAGQLVSFLLYAFSVAAAIMALASLWGSYQEAQGAARRVFDLLDRESTIVEPADPRSLAGHGPPEIAFDAVSFRYGETEPWALEAIDATIAPGEVVALVGPSGAGKTTFASLIPRFWDVTRGGVRVRGVDVRECALAELRSRIGVVPQDHPLFAGTIAENIAYARPDAHHAVMETAAAAAHAREFIERLPDGYETMVGERGVRLSGGQRQRIAIARVLLKEPEILILDEATSGLDAESEALVEEALQAASVGRTTVIIAHRLRTVRRADRLLVLDRGRLVDIGPHDVLIDRCALYRRLYEGQQLT